MEVSPYGLESLWVQGDIVTKGVAILLVAMSIASWYVILTKALQLFRLRRAGAAAGHQFWDTTSLPEGVATLGRDNPFAEVAKAGVSAMSHHQAHKGHLHEQLSVSDWVTLSLRQAIDEASAKLQTGMAVLASVGSTAPFVGLFGTVWGIMNSFIGISKAHTTNLAVVAPGIAEALLATAFGLAAAIPAVVIYNVFARQIAGYRAQLADTSAETLRLTSRDLDRRTGARKPVPAAAE
jgi:biopolymer transport protein ExbB